MEGPVQRRATAVLVVLVGLFGLSGVTGCSDGSHPGPVSDGRVVTPPAVTTSTAPPRDPSLPPAVPPGQGFSLVATGDVLLHKPIWEQAEADAEVSGRTPMDFEPMLAAVRPYVSSADLAMCHLETPLAPEKGPFSGYPVFSGPPQVADDLKATGYDFCSTASNHTLDKGKAGIRRTLDRLDEAGIAHAGSARTEAESKRITILKANGVRVAVLSYAFGFNGSTATGVERWRANRIDQARILADARRARRRGAQVVVLALHWGTEYQQTRSAQQRELAPKLARSGVVDLIISHHAHVVEPVQKIGSTWVVYGLGNLIANAAHPESANAEELLVRFSFVRRSDGRFRVKRAEYVPFLMAQDPLRLVDVRAALRSGEYGSSSEARVRRALRRTTTVVDSLGAKGDGLKPADRPRAAG
jgi:poly-gamma-glutamate capsule biosynthesis protein CapA/YwtB (metallophosphatase superfamily)